MEKLQGLWEYRVKRLRIVYSIHRAQRTERIAAVSHRRTIYEEVAKLSRLQE